MGKYYSRNLEYGYYPYWLCPICGTTYKTTRTLGWSCPACTHYERTNYFRKPYVCRVNPIRCVDMRLVIDMEEVCNKCKFKFTCFSTANNITKDVIAINISSRREYAGKRYPSFIKDLPQKVCISDFIVPRFK